MSHRRSNRSTCQADESEKVAEQHFDALKMINLTIHQRMHHRIGTNTRLPGIESSEQTKMKMLSNSRTNPKTKEHTLLYAITINASTKSTSPPCLPLKLGEYPTSHRNSSGPTPVRNPPSQSDPSSRQVLTNDLLRFSVRYKDHPYRERVYARHIRVSVKPHQYHVNILQRSGTHQRQRRINSGRSKPSKSWADKATKKQGLKTGNTTQ